MDIKKLFRSALFITILCIAAGSSIVYSQSKVHIVGDFQSELGYADWDIQCPVTELKYNPAEGNYEGKINIPTGNWLFKIVHDQNLELSYGINGKLNGSNYNLQVDKLTGVLFIYNPTTNNVTTKLLAPLLSAEMTDNPGTDTFPDGKVNPGEKVEYTVVIKNSGTENAKDVVFDDTLDPNTTFETGTLKTTPIAVDDTNSTNFETQLITVAPEVLANDFDADGSGALVVVSFGPTANPDNTAVGLTDVSDNGGNVTVSGDGSYVYDPPTGFTGTDKFGYTAQDVDGNQNSATVNIEISGQPPVANADSGYVIATGGTINVPDGITDLLFNDNLGNPVATLVSFGAGDLGGAVTDNAAGATVTPIPGFTNGSLTVNADGSFDFTAPTTPTTLTGSFNFEYRIQNVQGSSDANVKIEIQESPVAVADPNGGLPTNSAPSGINAHPYHTALNTQLVVPDGLDDLLANDTPGSPVGAITSYGLSNDATVQTTIGSLTPTDSGGTVSVALDGSFTYNPPSPTYTGIDQFAYRLENATSFSDAVVTVSVGFRPNAADDGPVAVTGNISINTANISPTAFSVFDNDTGDDLAVTGFDATSTNSGTVTFNTGTGEFTYNPPAGFNGNDTFTYTMENGFGSSVGTVTLAVSDMIWFISNGGPAGDGRLGSPFNSIGAFNTNNTGTAPGGKPGDFAALNIGTFNESITLLNNQRLLGQADIPTELTNISSSLAPGSDPLPTLASRPVITSTPTGDGITLAMDNTIRGLDVGNTPAGTGIIDGGSTVGNLTVSNVAINGTGRVLNIANGGTMASVSFDELSTTSSTASGIDLTNVAGTITIGSTGGGISGTAASSPAININGGSVGFTYSKNVTKANAGSAVKVSGGHTGTIVFSGIVNATDGDGLQFDNADGNYSFNGTTTLNGGNAGIDILNGSSGSFTLGTGTTITNPSGRSFEVINSDAAIAYSGSISDADDVVVNIDNHDAGTITFQTGSITSGGTGIRVANNNGGTVNFNGNLNLTTGTSNAVSLTNNAGGTINIGGTLAINTTSGRGYNATGGGTINVTGVGNILTSTTGRAVNIDNTTIGSSGVTFQSVSVNGASTGINLNSTGTGAFNVTGTGTTNGSGGTLQNCNVDAVILNTAQNVTLKNMSILNTLGSVDILSGENAVEITNGTNIILDNVDINDTDGDAILGTNVAGFQFINGEVRNAGEVPVSGTENGIFLTNVSGTVNFNNCVIDGSQTRNVLIENNTGTANITVNNSTIDNAIRETGFDVQSDGTANITLNVTDCSFTTNNAPQIRTVSEGSSILDATITGSFFRGDINTIGNSGIDLVAVGTSSVTFDVSGTPTNPQTFDPFRSVVINVFASDGGTATGRITGNTINQSLLGSGIRNVASVTTSLNPSIISEIKDNLINNIGGAGASGIYVESQQGVGTATGQANVQAVIDNNNITINGADACIQGRANAGNTLCMDVKNNSAAGQATSPFAGFGSTIYIGNPVSGTGSTPGTVTYNGYIVGDLGTAWNNALNAPVLAPGIAGEAFVDGTQPVAGTCTPVPPVNNSTE